MREHEISAVLSLCDAACAVEQRSVCVPDCDDYDLTPHLRPCAAWIAEQQRRGRAVLVHCRLGRSRSAAIVLAFLLQQGWTLRDAYAHLLRCHAPTSPNMGFFRQLQRLEQRLGGASLDQPLRRTRSYDAAPPKI